MADIELTLRFPEDKLSQAVQLLQSLQANQPDVEKVVREHLEGIASRNLKRIKETTSTSFKMASDALPSFNPEGSTKGDRERYFQLWENLWSSFPNTQYDVERLIISGNIAVCCWRGSGAHQAGKWASVGPTGQSLDIHGCSVYEVNEGKITALYNYMDTGRIYGQMGFRPTFVGGVQHTFTPLQPPAGTTPGGPGGGPAGGQP